jgi:hypothetical protein
MCVPRWPPFVGFEAQQINRSLLGFEVQTKKPSRWSWGPNYQTIPANFEAQTRKPEPQVLRPNQEKPSPLVLRPSQRKSSPPILRPNRRKPSQWFWGQTTNKPSQWFWGQTTNKPLTLVLMLNQEMVQTAHDVTRPPDRPITEYPTVRPSPVLCTRSPTPGTILVATRHAAPATCTPWDKQTWFSKRNKDKGKPTEMSHI